MEVTQNMTPSKCEDKNPDKTSTPLVINGDVFRACNGWAVISDGSFPAIIVASLPGATTMGAGVSAAAPSELNTAFQKASSNTSHPLRYLSIKPKQERACEPY